MKPIQFEFRDSIVFRLVTDDFSYDWYAAVNNNTFYLSINDVAFIIDVNTLAQIDTLSLKSIDQYLLQQTAS